MPQATFDEVLDAIERLPIDEQADLLKVVQRRLAEHARQRIVADIKQARSEFRNGEAQPTSVEDLMREIQS